MTHDDDENLLIESRAAEVVSARRGGAWWVLLEDGRGLRLARENFGHDIPLGLAPRVGDVVSVYGTPTSIHGVDLNGRRLFRCAARASRQPWWVMDTEYATVATLPEPLRRRFRQLRADRPDWFWYPGREIEELAASCDADLIARHLRELHGWTEERIATREARRKIREFARLPERERRLHVPMLRANNFSFACYLAFVLLTGRPVVEPPRS